MATFKKKIAIIHPNFELFGGAEFVSLSIIKALKDMYDITLITLYPFFLDKLNKFYNLDLKKNEFSLISPYNLSIFAKVIGKISRERLLTTYGIMRYANNLLSTTLK